MVDSRWLDARTAASHLGLPDKDAFLRKVKLGVLPAPSYRLGSRMPRWDRDALDSAMAGTPSSGPRHIVTQEVHDILAKGRAGRQAKASGRHYGRVPLPGVERQA